MTSTWHRSVKRKWDQTAPATTNDVLSARVESDDELFALRETLAQHQEAIDDLISELDEERNAASTAASEAMSMILRLQREKAEVQMEFRQFKRFADEKMAHDQDQIAALDDLIVKYDQTIESLNSDVETYKNRLMSHGIDDSSDLEQKNTESSDPETRDYETEAEEKAAAGPNPDSGDDSSDNGSDDDDYENARVYTIDAVHAVPITETSNGETESKDTRGNFDENGDIKKLHSRLQALEADRELMRQAIVSMRTEKVQIVLLKEIAQRLCQEVKLERRVVKRPSSLLSNFSFIAVIKWILSFIFWRKKASQSKKSFGFSNSNVGLLLLLDKSPRLSSVRR